MPNERILVVDDGEIICEYFKDELEEKGYTVDIALRGSIAIEKVKSRKYDIIFIDFAMPGMNGVETCREIKKTSPDSILIFMTGNFDRESAFGEADFTRAGGKTYYLYKPFYENEIIEVIEKALKERDQNN